MLGIEESEAQNLYLICLFLLGSSKNALEISLLKQNQHFDSLLRITWDIFLTESL